MHSYIVDGIIGIGAAILTLPQALVDNSGRSICGLPMTERTFEVAIKNLNHATSLLGNFYSSILLLIDSEDTVVKPEEPNKPLSSRIKPWLEQAYDSQSTLVSLVGARVVALVYTLARVLERVGELLYVIIALPCSAAYLGTWDQANAAAIRGLNSLGVITTLFEGVVGFINPTLLGDSLNPGYYGLA